MIHSENYGPNGRDAVFVLDDREEIGELTSGYFESAGIPAFSASDAGVAWDRLEEKHQTVRLALIDKNLHQDRDGGIKFLEEARRRYPDVVFVLITGWSLSAADRSRIEAGDISWLDKGALAPAGLLALYQKPKTVNLQGLLPIQSVLGDEIRDSPKVQEDPLKSSFRDETIHALRAENRGLRVAVREIASDLVRRLRNDRFSADEAAIFLNGRDLTIDDLIEEIESCTTLGMRLLKVHFSVIDDLISGKHRWGRRK